MFNLLNPVKEGSRKPLFHHLMAWLVAILVVLFVALEFILLNHFHEHVTDDARKSADDMAISMHILLKQNMRSLEILSQALASDDMMIQAIQSSQRDLIETRWRTLFQNLKESHDITHASFLDNQRHVVLRMAKPSVYGNKVERFLVLEAERSGKMMWGLEISSIGTLILRTVYPVYKNGVCIGYIELGKELENIFRALHVRLNSHLAVILDKQRILEKSEQIPLNTSDSYHATGTVIYTSKQTLPKEVQFVSEREELLSFREIFFDNKSWLTYSKALHDAEGNVLGNILLFYDITYDKETFVKFALQGTVIGIMLLAMILVFIHRLLHRTDRHIVKQQQKRVESEQRVKELATQSRTIFWEIDAYGMFTYISEIEESLMGYNHNEVEGKMYFYDMYSKTQNQGYEERARWIFNAREPLVNKEDQLVTKNGSFIWVLVNAIPLFDLQGVFRGYRGILTDITKRKKAEEAQKEAMERIQKIASRIPGVIYQYRLRSDGTSAFPFASAAIYNIYRVTPQEVEEDASKVFEVIHPEDREGVVDSIQKSAHTLMPWRHEYRVRFNDGEVRWLFGNALPQKEFDGSVLWYGFIDDITERKFMEEELKALNEALDKRVEEEISARLRVEKEQEAERQFLVQKAKLSSMGEMMGAIAHQWRQPLNALYLNIQNLDDDFDDGKIDRWFLTQFIAKNKKTILFMSKTIDDFRNFFKIDKEKQTFSVKDAIVETLSLQSAQFKNRNIEVEVIGKDFSFFSYKGEFQQVILNLLNNAKDAILERNIELGKITITLDPKFITLEDNAGGIDPAIIERIFEPYFTTKEQGEGTGIGLYMSKMIIEKNMGGVLRVVNTDIGAQFIITFAHESSKSSPKVV